MNVAIIIVSYNSSDDVIRLCGEIRHQFDLNIHYSIRIFDNASRAEEQAKLSAHFIADQDGQEKDQICLMLSEDNLGFAAACNLACKTEAADYFLFLNPDIHLYPGTLNNLVAAAIDDQPKSSRGIWGGITLNQNGRPDSHSAWREPSLTNTLGWATGLSRIFNMPMLQSGYLVTTDKAQMDVDAVSGCCLLIRSSLWYRLKGFDLRFFLYSEEIDLCRRARSTGVQPTLVTNSHLTHRGRASMPSTAQLQYLFTGKALYAEKHFGALKQRAFKLLCGFGALIRAMLKRGAKRQQWRQLFLKMSNGQLRYTQLDAD